jgi:hypothetical protein
MNYTSPNRLIVIFFFIPFVFFSNLLFSNERLVENLNEKYDNRYFNVSTSFEKNVQNENEISESINTQECDAFGLPLSGGAFTSTSVDTVKFDAAFDPATLTSVDNINSENLINLPIGLSKDIGGTNAQLIVVNAYFMTDYIMLDILAKVDWNGKDTSGKPVKRTLRLGCWGVKYYYEYGFQGEMKIALLKDVSIPISADGSNLIIKGDFNKNTGVVDFEKATYLSFGCNGFESLEGHFVGSLELKSNGSNNTIKPVVRDKNDKDKFIKDNLKKSLKVDFNTTCSLTDFFFSTSLGLFTIGNSDLIFDVKELTVDLSSTQSPLIKGNDFAWEGFYVKDFTVYLPESLSKNVNSKKIRVSARAKDLSVDEFGISGEISGNNLSSLSNGSAGGWPLSVNKLSFSLKESVLSAVGIEGAVQLPVTNETSSIKYSCIFNPVNQIYSFGLDVVKEKPLGLDVFLADITLGGGSLKLEKGKYGKPDIITATLNEGKISLKGDKLSDFSLGFKNFEISNKPSITIKTLSPKEGDKPGVLANFPITLDEISFNVDKLKIGLNLNLMETKISGAVDATISCKTTTDTKGRQKWAYDGLNISKVSVNANFDKFALKGFVEMYESPTDKGFRGEVDMKMLLTPPSDSLKIKAVAIFGAKKETNQSTGVISSFRYWHVDMQAQFPPFQIFPNVKMSGLGGGGCKPHVTRRIWQFPT